MTFRFFNKTTNQAVHLSANCIDHAWACLRCDVSDISQWVVTGASQFSRKLWGEV